MITTIHGDMDEALLEKRTGIADGGIDWTEYWIDGELVHRSVNLTLTGVEMKIQQGEMNG